MLFRASAGDSFKRLGVVVSGESLTAIHRDRDLEKSFVRFCLFANAVICARATPGQKSQLVSLIKESGPWRILCVGDGANDVPMILEAHVGVGVVGKEGNQAVMAADYAIHEFHFLVPLLLWHGRIAYRRVAVFICYYFYKNVILVLTELAFAPMNGYSGQIFFADWLPMLYNIVWTSLPPIFTFIFEQDVSPKDSVENPQFYRAGQRHEYFNFWSFWKWIIWALSHGLFCFYITIYVCISPGYTSVGNGRTQRLERDHEGTLVAHNARLHAGAAHRHIQDLPRGRVLELPQPPRRRDLNRGILPDPGLSLRPSRRRVPPAPAHRDARGALPA